MRPIGIITGSHDGTGACGVVGGGGGISEYIERFVVFATCLLFSPPKRNKNVSLNMSF